MAEPPLSSNVSPDRDWPAEIADTAVRLIDQVRHKTTQPAITAVLDGAAYTNNVAQGSVFVVKGTGLSAAGLVSAPAPLYPTTLNNVRISLTAVTGGAPA